MSEETIAPQEQESVEESTQEEMISRSEYEEKMALKDKAIKELREKLETSDEDSVEEETDITDVDSIVERAKKEALRELREEEASRYRDTALPEVYKSEWGAKYSPENDPTGSNMKKMNEALKTINLLHPVRSADDTLRNMRLANQIVEGSVDTSMEQSQEAQQATIQAGMAAGASGSNVRRDSVTPAKLSPMEAEILRASGVDPNEYKG